MGDDSIPPALYGPENYRHLIVCWGSTLGCVREALALSGRADTAVLHFSQIYPLHGETAAYLERAKTKMIIENNATSQFGTLVKIHTGVDFDRRILKYNGMPFMVEEIVDAITSL